LIQFPTWSLGALATASTQSGPSASVSISAESLRPPAPVNLTAAIETTGDLEVSWTRRSREGWSWIDEVDAPLSERVEQYRVMLINAAGAAEFLADQTNLTVSATTVAELGAGPAAGEGRPAGGFA